MNKQVIAVIGQGFVGGSLSIGMSHAFDVYAYDKAGKAAESIRGQVINGKKKYDVDSISEFRNKLESDKKINFTGIYFIAVPTPMNADGSANIDIVDSVLEELASSPNNERIAVIKSTCPPGSTDLWNKKYNKKGLYVIFNPEFLTEANAIQDFLNQDRIVLGGPRPWINKVKEVFNIAYPSIPVVKSSAANAELVKYVTNTFLATKVSYANEIYDICQKLDNAGFNTDYDRVIELATLDKRLGISHWKVPGPMPADNDTGNLLRGFAGSCFVKDLNALINTAKQFKVNPTILDAVWNKNLEVRPEKDWENLVGRAVTKK